SGPCNLCLRPADPGGSYVYITHTVLACWCGIGYIRDQRRHEVKSRYDDQDRRHRSDPTPPYNRAWYLPARISRQGILTEPRSSSLTHETLKDLRLEVAIRMGRYGRDLRVGVI